MIVNRITLMFALSILIMIVALVFGADALSQGGARFGGIIVAVSICAIGGFALIGLFEHKIENYALLSALIQLGWFFLAIGAAVYFGKSVWLGAAILANYAIAGALFALVFGLISRERNSLEECSGVFANNQFLAAAFGVGCLALAGLPGLNVFVGVFMVYELLHSISAMIAGAAFFASLLCLVFYLRAVYVAFGGEARKKIRVDPVSRSLISALVALVIILGVTPYILTRFVEALV
ncbi:MAG: proton-conducting transporter membrane subunit [Candidatus Micrarchaeota archaeon]